MLHKTAWGGRAHLPLPGLEPVGGEPPTTNVCDALPVRRQTYGYLPSRKASPPIGWYQIILLGDRHTCVTNLPGVALDSGAAGIRTHDLLLASPAPYRYATHPATGITDKVVDEF